MMKRIVIAFASACILAGLFGCGGGGSSSGQAPDPEVRYFNGSADSDPLDFFMNDELAVAALAFLSSTPDFVDTEPLVRDITIQETGQTKAIWTESFEFERDRDYLVCALGLVDFGSEPLKRARITRYEIDRTLPNANKARIYVIHGFNRSAGLETPNIDFQNPGSNPQVRIANLEYLSEGHRDIDATTQTFEARRAGTESVFVSTTFTFQSGKIYAVVIHGIEGGAGVLAPGINIFELSVE